MKNSKNISTVKAAVGVLFSLAMVVTAIITPTLEASAQSADRIFESQEDGFRLQIPQGWVIEDHDNMSLEPNGEVVATLCLENEALPGLGGEFNCLAANRTDGIYIHRWPDLQSMPEFQNESDDGSNIIPTTNDLVALWIRYLENGNSTSRIQIENTTDVDEFRKIINMTYTFLENAGTSLPFDDYTYDVNSAIMFVLSQDRNTGYIINNNVALVSDNQTELHSPAVQEVFSSFVIVEEE
jgi:hypothetical protein